MAVYLAAWGAAVAYLAAQGGNWALPVAMLVVFGGFLSPLALWLTRRSRAPALPVPGPRRESLAVLAYLAIYAFVFFGPVYGWLLDAVPDGRAADVTGLCFKLAVHVVLPTLLLLAIGGRIAEMWDTGLGRKGVISATILLSAAMFALVALVSPALEAIGDLGLSMPSAMGWVLFSWIWMALVAGLCEEYLFRAGLQSRLAAWLQSPAMAIALTSILFALVHAPGLYLRGDAETFGHSPDIFQVMAYTVGVISPVSILFGVLWHRTRSLLLVVIVHGAVDALPFTAELAARWGG